MFSRKINVAVAQEIMIAAINDLINVLRVLDGEG